MSPPGRPKGEYRSAKHEGTPMSPPGRPKGEYRSAPHQGTPVNAAVCATLGHVSDEAASELIAAARSRALAR